MEAAYITRGSIYLALERELLMSLTKENPEYEAISEMGQALRLLFCKQDVNIITSINFPSMRGNLQKRCIFYESVFS